MDNLLQSTIEYLTKAGWYTGRKIPLVKYRACLESEGFSWFPKVAEFLEEFGELLVKFKRESGELDTLSFRACEASTSFDSCWLTEGYTRRIGRSQFCVIGQAYASHLLLFMDDIGNVYGGFDEFLCLININGRKAIETICSNYSTIGVLE